MVWWRVFGTQYKMIDYIYKIIKLPQYFKKKGWIGPAYLYICWKPVSILTRELKCSFSIYTNKFNSRLVIKYSIQTELSRYVTSVLLRSVKFQLQLRYSMYIPANLSSERVPSASSLAQFYLKSNYTELSLGTNFGTVRCKLNISSDLLWFVIYQVMIALLALLFLLICSVSQLLSDKIGGDIWFLIRTMAVQILKNWNVPFPFWHTNLTWNLVLNNCCLLVYFVFKL